MNPHTRYRTATAIAWTRIDMLLLIYENAIESLDKGIHLLEADEGSEMLHARVDAQRKVLLIAEGLNVDEDPTAAHIMNLCVFILDQIATDSLENWRSSLKLLETLHEGFQQIAEEARELERKGTIPALTV